MPTLYRYYDEYGRLLYVGQTGQGLQRFAAHAGGSAWWQFVDFAEFHHLDASRIDLAERLSIWVDRPLFNRARRVSTEQRQAMRAKIDFTSELLIGPREAAGIVGLAPADIARAVRWGFLETDYPRAMWLTAEQLGAFIGESDDGLASTDGWIPILTDRYHRRLSPELIRSFTRSPARPE